MAGNNIYVQGSYIDIHDNEVVNLSVDKAQVRVGEKSIPSASRKRPEQLMNERAEGLMQLLVDGGVLDADWQPLGLSGPERGLVAKAVSDRLVLQEVWQVFGLLWNEKPETLRGYFNKALDQKKSLEYQEKLKKILG